MGIYNDYDVGLQSHHKDSTPVDDFVFMTKAKVIKEGRRPVYNSFDDSIDIRTMANEYTSRVQITTEPTTTIEIDNKALQRVMRDVDEFEKLRKSYTRVIDYIAEVDSDNREFHKFFAQNPELRDQYRELMVMCKLAGLRKVPEKFQLK